MTRSAAMALFLAVQLLGGLTPGQVLCLHHDGGLTIERAARGAVRCDDISVPCVAGGLAMAHEDAHCHDAAIAQPGLTQRAVSPAAHDLALVVGRPAPAVDPASCGPATRSGRAPGCTAASRRSVVLRV